MKKDYFGLLKDKGFGPLFMVQLLGAFHDMLFRSALIISVTFGLLDYQGDSLSLMPTIVAGVAILPFFLFSSIAGQLADKYDRSFLVKVIKGGEIVVILLAIYGLWISSFSIMLAALFLTLLQSTLFGPIKYSLIPIYLPGNQIITGNALVEASTFLSILVGTALGGILVRMPHYGTALLGTVMLLSVVSSWVISLRLPKTEPAEPSLKLNWNLYKETLAIIRYAASDRVIFLAIIGISWFWVIGSVMLTEIALYGKQFIGDNESIAIIFMFMFTTGVGLGSYVCNMLQRGQIDARLVPVGAIVTTVFIIDLVLASYHINDAGLIFDTLKQFLRSTVGLRVCFDLLMIAVGTGVCMVPLYAIVQTQADPKHCSRVIAANNVMNAFFMVVSVLITLVLKTFGVSLLNIFLAVAIMNLFMAHRLSILVPESILQLFLQMLFKLFYRIEIKGMENFHKAGDRVLIIGNHISFIDAAIIFAFIPAKLSFAIYTFYINKWWIRLIRGNTHLLPIDPTNPMSVKQLVELIRSGKKCVIFPEGRLTVTGSLMKVFDGPGVVADKADANILPIHIAGAQYTYFSRLGGKVRRKSFPKISMTILPPRKVDVVDEIQGKERRRIISNQIYDVMRSMNFDNSPYEETICTALVAAAKQHGMGRMIAEDIQRDPITYRQLLMKTFIIGRYMSQLTVPGEYVGVMLPTSVPAMLSFFGLLMFGRIPAMLNFSHGPKTIRQTCTLTKLRLVITSRKFIEVAKLESVIEELKDTVTFFYLEDLKSEIGLAQKLQGVLCAYFPAIASRKAQRNVLPSDPAVILFTSGSEGMPKGVALSHINLNANRFQVTTSIDLNVQDVVLNVLPVFHSFGLTGGLLMPVLSGIKTFLYPSPLHYRIIPVIAYDTNASIFFATDTFLSKYAVSAHPYDFYAMRYVVAGAEKLRAETRQLWMDKFGIQVYEGYGTTEAAPGVSLNTRMQNKVGTVGRFVPAMEWKLRPVPGVHEGGRLLIRGPNVMLGYVDPVLGKIAPTQGVLVDGEEPQLGWYDTGDIVDIDREGYITIKGRAKRFAKIAGEMVSLAAVEEILYRHFKDSGHVVFAVPDKRKGEQLALLTTAPIEREHIIEKFRGDGITELMLPRYIFQVDEIPLLTTGKTDFQGAKELLSKLMPEQPDNG